jgi:phage shock protein A
MASKKKLTPEELDDCTKAAVTTIVAGLDIAGAVERYMRMRGRIKSRKEVAQHVDESFFVELTDIMDEEFDDAVRMMVEEILERIATYK